LIDKRVWLMPATLGLIIGCLFILFQLWDKKTVNLALEPTQFSYADIIEPILPFTVSILTNKNARPLSNALTTDPYFSKFLQNEPVPQTSLGSGIVLNTTGDIVTNAHVVNDASEILIMTHLGQLARVSQVLVDPETDIALLRTDLRLSNNLPVKTDNSYRVGDIVFTIGNPFGIGQSVSMGVISAKGRQQPGLTRLTDFIQTDAAINPGNSGGALVDANGQTIGMNTAIFSSSGGSQGIGFAIPINTVLDVANELSNKGKVTRGYLGIDVEELSPIEAEKLGLPSPSSGLKVVSVQQGSPAETAGINSGDLLIEINGTKLTTRTQAARIISQLMPGKRTDIKIERFGERINLIATLTVRD
jgi:S1-C subfamily serine protease